MGDSDDEYDRKRRDKFRGERGGTAGAEGGAYRGGERRGEERTRGREDWADRNRRDYREYRGGGAGGGRERGYSPGRGDGPPAKRIRGDWEDLGRPRYTSAHDGYGSYGWSHDHYGHHPPHQAYGHGAAQHRETTNGTIGETQPAMMSFKAFLGAQDDAITDDDAIKKYNDYKLEFRRQQLNEFFVAHKDEEWFKIKYHPEESLKRKEEQLTSLRNRLTVFMELLNEGLVESVSVESDQSDNLIRLLDTVVIKLEGGDEEDLKVLDEKPKPLPLIERPAEAEVIIENSEEATPVTSAVDEVANPEKKVTEEVPKGSPQKEKESDDLPELEKSESNDETAEEKKESTEEDSKDIEMKDDTEEEKIEEEKIEKPKKPEKAKKRKREYSSGSGSSSSSDSESETETAAPKSPEPEKEIQEEGEEEKKSDIEDGEEVPEITEPEKKEEEEKEVPTVEVEDENKEKEPRALHKTTSIFLRNLSPTITKAEVEAMCKRYTGYLRVAIADPLQERRWFRRGWLTFRREVNIKEICWNLNNIRLRECELGAIVNRDLSRRVRPVNGLTAHKQVVRSDIKLCAKITHNLDSKANLWSENNEEKKTVQQSFGLVSKNPVLHNITDYLIEEASAEEDELLGLTGSADNGESDAGQGETIERDPGLTKVLDKLILYLRIVHSVDFYNHCEYPYEDEMPNRCGIMHARGPAPSNKVNQNEINEYIRMFEAKMSTFLTPSLELDDDELNKLGSKDCEGEVEKFVLANTQELAKDKWLCPLSGKKFKGPDFIRKHIFNKHGEKVEEVKKEVEYFNNYLKDPKRPQLPEHPGNTRKPSEGAVAHHPPPYGAYGPPPGPAYGGRGGYHHGPYGGFGFQGYAPRPRGGFNRGRGADFRPLLHYRDLDAPPRDLDEFI